MTTSSADILSLLDNLDALNELQRIRPVIDHEALRLAYARACWSTVVEPGDGDAGTLIAQFGPIEALQLAASTPPDRFAAVIDAAIRDSSEKDEVSDSSFIHVEHRDWAAAAARWQPRMHPERIRALIRAAANIGARFVVPGDRSWPDSFADLGAHVPCGLWVRGNLQELTAPVKLSLVGSRASTAYGDTVTGEIAASAADAGVVVVSGGAYGIDAQAHRVTIASGGTTLAVLAGGADRLYPAGNRELLERTITSGAVLSESPCGTAPTRWRFLQRNRLIAALANATIVVEAGARSGAMNTANHALTLGRALGAVPGPITSSTSVGCHQLIQAGTASLIAGAADALALCANAAEPSLFDTGALGELAAGCDLAIDSVLPTVGDFPVSPTSNTRSQRAKVSASLDPLLVRTLDALGVRAARTVDDLSRRSGLSPSDIRAGLSELEVLGHARESAGKWRRCA